MAVFVLDKKKQPLMPCSEKRARLLLDRKRAVVVRVYPFTIRLKDRIGGALQPVRVKLDPGSKVTGIAVVRDTEVVDTETGEVTRGAAVLNLIELENRGARISQKLAARAALRRGRRGRKLRYRAPRFLKIMAQLQVPLKDATAVNATRWALFRALKATGLPVECSSGGRTKWNRSRFGIPKTHALDAACVGHVDALEGWQVPVTGIRATGRGAYCRTRVNASGFPRSYRMRKKRVCGFQTGDMVRACVPRGKSAGTYIGRVTVRASGWFDIQTGTAIVQGIGAKHFTLILRNDGYAYTQHASSAA
jgi:hypothetical protein